jgi:hypothetical protein
MNSTTVRSLGKKLQLPLPFACFLAAIVLIYFALAAWGIKKPFWADEEHFVQAVTLFGNSPTLHTLQHYEELAPPLSFAAYALWGRMVGFSLPRLRILSLLVGLATALCCLYLFSKTLQNQWIAMTGALFVMMNPYMLGAGIFVFTDMSAILFELLVLIAVIRGNVWLLGLSLTGAILCRQYLAFLTLAVGLFYLIRIVIGKDRMAWKYLISTCLSIIPLVSLMIFWGGISPQNTVTFKYITEPFSFHWSALSLYICQTFIYLSPVILLCWKKIYSKWQFLTAAAASLGIYWFMPIKASSFAISYSMLDTLGYFHRFVRIFLMKPTDQIVFDACFAAAIPILLALVSEVIKAWRSRTFSIGFLVSISAICFLIIMPFSYLAWEKYFLPAIPILTVWLLRLRQVNTPRA